jgi:hypothetical protein
MFSSKATCLAVSLILAMTPATVCMAADSHLNFKIYSPQDPPAESPSGETTPAEAPTAEPAAESAVESPVADTTTSDKSIFEEEKPAAAAAPVVEPSAVSDMPSLDTPLAVPSETTPAAASTSSPASSPAAAAEPAPEVSTETTETTKETTVVKSKEKESKVLQGYIRVVPTGTKIPIVMDTAVDSETSQEGDEFSARTSEDLTIDGNTVVPAGSIIKGRIATMNAARALNRSGSVALKFDNITTPDNRQIPLVATIVARGGVVHARRGLKDIAIDAGTVALPVVAGLAIGALAGNSSNNNSNGTSSGGGMGKGGAAVLGAGIGLAVGVAVLLAKKGKKIEVRPGDELKIELAEELRMPTM